MISNKVLTNLIHYVKFPSKSFWPDHRSRYDPRKKQEKPCKQTGTKIKNKEMCHSLRMRIVDRNTFFDMRDRYIGLSLWKGCNMHRLKRCAKIINCKALPMVTSDPKMLEYSRVNHALTRSHIHCCTMRSIHTFSTANANIYRRDNPCNVWLYDESALGSRKSRRRGWARRTTDSVSHRRQE